MSILDIGCGFGWFEYQLLNQDIKEICGIELLESDLSIAKQVIRDKRVKFTTGSALKLPFEDDKFDIIVAWEVIEHIPKSTESIMFKEVNRVLKPGGSFYLSTPYASILSMILDPAWWLISHRHYSEVKLRQFGEDAALEVEMLAIRGAIWSLTNSLNMYISKWIFHREPFKKEFFLSKEASEYGGKGGIANIFAKYTKREIVYE